MCYIGYFYVRFLRSRSLRLCSIKTLITVRTYLLFHSYLMVGQCNCIKRHLLYVRMRVVYPSGCMCVFEFFSLHFYSINQLYFTCMNVSIDLLFCFFFLFCRFNMRSCEFFIKIYFDTTTLGWNFVNVFVGWVTQKLYRFPSHLDGVPLAKFPNVNKINVVRSVICSVNGYIYLPFVWQFRIESNGSVFFFVIFRFSLVTFASSHRKNHILYIPLSTCLSQGFPSPIYFVPFRLYRLIRFSLTKWRYEWYNWSCYFRYQICFRSNQNTHIIHRSYVGHMLYFYFFFSFSLITETTWIDLEVRLMCDERALHMAVLRCAIV